LKREQADIIVIRYWLPFMGPCFGTLLRLARRSGKSRVVCIADNVIPHEKRPGDTWFTRYFMKPVDGFVTMSKKVLSDLQLFTHKPALQVVHPLYDNFGDIMPSHEAREKIGLPPSGKLVLFFGFIRKYKGLDLLFESIAMLKQQNFFATNQVQFVIAGEFYEPEAPYMKMIDELKIADHLILRNHFITDHEVKYYLNAADCVIQPYKQATQSGVTPLAYHFEKPMIVTNVGGLADMVPEHIGLVAEPTATSISKSIVEFFAKDSAPFVAALHEEKKKYSWSNITGAIVSLADSH
ncbi:MAG TPA: glycosyltransferase, partial [Chitinophagaceae bacterium]|nr:glycosyltransferase [Chitinophagaceae bacterium]